MTVDPKKRLTASGAVTHPWLLSKDTDLLHNNLGVNLEQLKLFNARRKLRAAIKSVSARAARWGRLGRGVPGVRGVGGGLC